MATDRTKTRLVLSELVADKWLFFAAVTLLGVGLVFVGSASFNISERQFGEPFHFIRNQALYVVVGIISGAIVLQIPLIWWQRWANLLLGLGILGLLLVLIPGVGKTVNGSARWLSLGPISFQMSEVVKLLMVIYYAAFLVKHPDLGSQPFKSFLVALAPLAAAGLLMLLEPDLGATCVVAATVVGMLFLAGVRLRHLLVLGALGGGLLSMLIVYTPYRFGRLNSFLHACEPEYALNQGYQLCQALIAFGRGDWLGVGLGSGVQKLFYLPEAHTDFLLAIVAEEVGAVGTLLLIGLFGVLVARGFLIARYAEMIGEPFAAYVAYGVTCWLGVQAAISMGVNMGLLPTKGLTLPLISYGGSSVVITVAAIGLLLRVAFEARRDDDQLKAKNVWV